MTTTTLASASDLRAAATAARDACDALDRACALLPGAMVAEIATPEERLGDRLAVMADRLHALWSDLDAAATRAGSR